MEGAVAVQDGFVGSSSNEVVSFVIAELKADRAKLAERYK